MPFRVKEYREKQGMTQEELSKKADIFASNKTYGRMKIEKGNLYAT